MECIKLLLSYGADATIKNHYGEMATDKVQPDNNNKATILQLIEEVKTGNALYHSRHVLTP